MIFFRMDHATPPGSRSWDPHTYCALCIESSYSRFSPHWVLLFIKLKNNFLREVLNWLTGFPLCGVGDHTQSLTHAKHTLSYTLNFGLVKMTATASSAFPS